MRKFRVGRRCPWNVYEITRGDDRDSDLRFAVAFDPADGPRIAAAMNLFYEQEADRAVQEQGSVEVHVRAASEDRASLG